MKLSKKLLSELQNRLKIANRKSPLLNAIPGKSKIKLDLNALDSVQNNLSNKLIDKILTERTFYCNVSQHNIPEDENDEDTIHNCLRKLENLLTEKEIITSEKGVNPLGIGFPLLIKKSQDDKLIVAPLFIWTIDIQRGEKAKSFEIIRDEDDVIYFNDVLKNYIYNELQHTVNINLDDFLNEEGVFDAENLSDATSQVLEQINANIQPNLKDDFLEQLHKIQSAEAFEQQDALMNTKTDAIISFSGIISLFDVQKQSIIEDYEKLSEEDAYLSEGEEDDFDFQSITSVETDPSQQAVLNSISNEKNFVIQDPPGTGKSQTLTAILINALENNLKTMVVCEKKTALDVLEAGLKERELDEFSILIREPGRDRRKVVDKVRALLEISSEIKDNGQKDKFNGVLKQVKDSIQHINQGHQLLNRPLIGEMTWSDVVAEHLANNHNDVIRLNDIELSYEKEELDKIVSVLKNIEPKYKSFEKYSIESIINPTKFTGDNPFLLQEEFIENVRNYKTEINEIRRLKNENFDNSEEINFEDLDSLFSKIIAFFSKKKKQQLKTLHDIKQKVVALKGLTEKDNWFGIDSENMSFVGDLEKQCKVCEIYSQNKDIFIKEFDFQNAYNPLDGNIKAIIERIKTHKNWDEVFTKAYYNQILTQKASTKFPQDESNYDAYKERKSVFDAEQLKLIKENCSIQREKFIARFKIENNRYSIENLYNKRKSKKYKRLSLMEIVQFDTVLFLDFFPVVFITPEAASNLFPGNKKYFDLVLFDEASQLRVEDTLPALLKGKRMIVSGDQHQMPPSNYFISTIEGIVDEYEEETEEEVNKIPVDPNEILLSTESLLEFSSEINFKNRYLDFHYRSKHPLLIEFSNHAFYGGRRQPVPAKEDYIPIQYEQINGLYKDRTNEDEANAVIEKLKELHPNENGYFPTVGIATFNAPQRGLIIQKFQELKVSDLPETSHFATLEKNGLFIKNLENIQGEERDIIIISTTFGLNEDDAFKQVFGPLNQSKGYKLLNVIITRAKEKVVVLTSIPIERILNYKSELTQTQANNKRAVLYAYLAYAKAVSNQNEEEIQSVLEALDANTQAFQHKSTSLQTSEKFIEYVYTRLIEKDKNTNVLKHTKLGGFCWI